MGGVGAMRGGGGEVISGQTPLEGKDILEFSVVGVTKSKLAARSLYERHGVLVLLSYAYLPINDPVFPNSVFEYRRILVAERGLKWKARLAGGSGGILHSYES
ncbi:hypothetical protein J6590_070181 [Homalodisca vitripennis]|nr:hypothetical protein J6590_070181 [Homalodisca vitripennis]